MMDGTLRDESRAAMDTRVTMDESDVYHNGAGTVKGTLTLTVAFFMFVAGAALFAGCTGAVSHPGTGTGITPASVGVQVHGTTFNEPVSTPRDNPMTGNYTESPDFASHFIATEMLTRPTDHSVTVSIVPKEDLVVFFMYGTIPGSYSCRTPAVSVQAGSPASSTIMGLQPDTRYYYRTCYGEPGTIGYNFSPEHQFQTRRSAGSTFTFGIQADSHPERVNRMFNSALYEQTMQNVRNAQPDFYLSLGDDFSIDSVIEKGTLSKETVDAVYLSQREYLGILGSSSPVYLVNGNHEEAARYLLTGTLDNAAVYAGSARMQYFPQPVPDSFYTGDTSPVEYVGLPGDYYAWTWGDALFVVIDPYWHSPVAVDNVVGESTRSKRDLWMITLGETQYQWFKKTLEQSNATYKFVFSHHVSGTGRGGIENAMLYEWGGNDPKGAWAFDSRRPGWELPVQQLMAENNVTIFFQGHDHLFARQELDGIVYQEVPCPADPTYSMFNADAYRSGTKLPNSGYLRVTVSPQNVTVDYIKSFLPGRATGAETNGMVAYSYTVTGDRHDGGRT